MTACAFCNQDIPEDSFFCDQCGMELLVCVKCGTFGKGKFCGRDGGALSPRKNLSTGSTPPPPAVSIVIPRADNSNVNTVPAPAPIPPPQPQVISTIREQKSGTKLPGFATSNTVKSEPVCKLVNGSLNVEIEVKDQDILGRSQGPHAPVLSSMGKISGRHAMIHFNGQSQWQIEDCNSTNGTFVQNQQISPNTPVAICNGNLIRLANVEFLVQIESSGNDFQEGNPVMTIRM